MSHRCECGEICTCQCDTSTVTNLRAPTDCVHCLDDVKCEHGLSTSDVCYACVPAGLPAEALNGGW